MKKLVLILALAAIYAVSVSPAKANSADSTTQGVVITADTDDINILPEGDDEKDKKKKKTVKTTSSCCSGKAAAKTGCSEAQKKSCAASKVTCSETEKESKKDKK